MLKRHQLTGTATADAAALIQARPWFILRISSAVCNEHTRQKRQLTGAGPCAQCLLDLASRVQAAEFEGAVDAHQHRLGGGAALAPVALAVLAQYHRRTDLPLGEVVLPVRLGPVNVACPRSTGPPTMRAKRPGRAKRFSMSGQKSGLQSDVGSGGQAGRRR